MKKVLLIATGGTIASSETEFGLAPEISSDELIGFVPQIKECCEMDTKQIMSIDSSNLNPEDWLLMTKAIETEYKNYDGFIIAHGTDTMAYTSAALSYLIQNSKKPIVITGAQKPINANDTDAVKNVIDSVRVAVSGIGGVYVVFSGKIMAGTRVKKVRTKGYTAFESFNYPDIGYLRGDIPVFNFKPETEGEVKFYDKILPSVFLLKLIPGVTPEILDFVSDNYKAVVIESYGGGGLPFTKQRDFLSKLPVLHKKGVIVLIATQVTGDGTDLSVYEIGQRTLNSGFNVLQSYDMNVEAAVTKLMWLLGQSDDFETIKKEFYRPVFADILCETK